MPANDNFASATAISGASGYIAGTNVGATFEATEPQPEGQKTVWYKWTSPLPLTGGYLRVWYFSTRYNPSVPSSNPDVPLKTIVRAYTGTVLGGLTEVTYFGLSQNRQYAGWEYGSQIFFRAGSLTDYYIRVDGDGGAEGDFLLSWGENRNLTFGDCSSPSLHLGIGEECLGSVLTLGDVTQTSLVQDFGTFPVGNYLVIYVRGAWVHYAPGTLWGVLAPPGSGGQHIEIYKTGSVAVQFIGPEVAELTYVEAELAGQCTYARFKQTSEGLVQLHFTDPEGYNANAQSIKASYTNPQFAIYRATPVFAEAGANVIWLSGTTFRGTFNIQNLTRSDWSDITITIASSGNISGSTTITGFSVNALATTATASIDFDISPSGNTSAVATLQLSDGGVNTFADLAYDITPLIVPDVAFVTYEAMCPQGAVGTVSLDIVNNGYGQTLNLAMAVSFGAGVDMTLTTACAATSSFSLGAIGGNGANLFFQFRFRRTDSSVHSALMQLHFTDGPVDHGTFEFTITF